MRAPWLDPAARALAAVVPGSTGLLPDEIPWSTADPWIPFDLEAGDDAELGDTFLAALGRWLGPELVVVTEASWRESVGSFDVSRAQLPELIRQHAGLYGEPFFCGDVIIISPDTGRVLVVHHSGLMTAVHGIATPTS